MSNIVKFLGMQPCERSDKVPDNKNSHTLYLAGELWGEILLEEQLWEVAQSCLLKIRAGVSDGAQSALGWILRLVPAMISVSAVQSNWSWDQGGCCGGGNVGISPRVIWVELAVFMICGILLWSEPGVGKTAPLPNRTDEYQSS